MQTVELKINQAFGLPVPDQATVTGYKEPTPDVPEPDPDYVWVPETLRRMNLWWHSRLRSGGNDGLTISGHTGCGKSTLAEQFFNRINVPVWSVICSPRIEPEDIFGSMGLAGGSTFFNKGPAVRAAEAGGILLLEEGDRLDPTMLGMIAPLMEGKPFRIPGDGRLVEPQGLFGVVMTTNTRGGHDESGLYDGAKKQNLATMSRFQALSVDYPPAEEERAILERKVIAQQPVKRQAAVRDALSKFVDIANKVRDSFKDPTSGLDTTISTRVLLRWAELAVKCQSIDAIDDPIGMALDQALLDNAGRDTQDAVHEIVRGMLGN
jgi:cobaltochelatase CobS